MIPDPLIHAVAGLAIGGALLLPMAVLYAIVGALFSDAPPSTRPHLRISRTRPPHWIKASGRGRE